LWVF